MSTEDAIWELLSDATVRIDSASGDTLGSGFFIGPGRVLTAAHVVVPVGGPQLVVRTAQGHECRVISLEAAIPWKRRAGQDVWPLPDLAVLSITDLPDGTIPFVEMSEAFSCREVLVSGTAMGLTQLVNDRARLTYESTVVEHEVALHKFTGGRIAPGMSGGPVLDATSCKVVGMVKADRGDGTPGAYAISGSAIYRALPGVWAAHLDAHANESPWRIAANRARYATVGVASLEQYLEALAEAYAESPMLPRGVKRGKVRQPVRVRPLRAIGARLGEKSEMSDDDEPQSAPSLGEALLWDPLRSPWPAVAVLAGPGMGKTWLLSHHAVQIAAHSLERVREQPELHTDTRFPVFLNAATLARRLPVDAQLDDVVEAVAATLLRTLPSAPERDVLVPLLRLTLEDRRIVLCVDGLDEVPSDLRERLRAALTMLEPRLAQLIVSGRESARTTVERIFSGSHEEFEITGFSDGDVRRFYRAWHAGEEGLIQKVEQSLQENPNLRSLVHVPLLLSFVCRLAAAQRPLASTRSGLYREVALSVLAGRWRESTESTSDPRARLRMLARAVGPLASHWRGRPDEFSRHEVDQALRRDPEYEAIAAAAEARWRSSQDYLERTGGAPPRSPILWEFEYDGLLMESTGADDTPTLRFTHLVFGELCMAMWLADLEDDEQLTEQIESHRWFDDQWLDIVPIACGVAAEPERILQRVAVAGADPWLAQSTLQARCMAEAPHATGADAAQALVDQVIGHLNTGPRADAAAARRCFDVLVTGRVPGARERLTSALQDEALVHEDDRQAVMRLLCQMGDAYAIAACRAVLEERSTPQWVRDEAARAICRSNDKDAVALVIERYAPRRGGHEHLAIFLADGGVATAAGVAMVARVDVDPALRVAIAIQQIYLNGDDAAATALLDDISVGLAGQVRLHVALLRSGLAADGARALISNPDVVDVERLELVHALLLRGDLSVLQIAADLAVDLNLDHNRRRDLCRTMMSTGRDGTAALYNSATDTLRLPEARFQALLALIERRHVQGAQAAATLIANGHGPVWMRARLLALLLQHAPDYADRTALVNLLADRDLTDGPLNSAWEDLAATAVETGDAEIRDNLADRLRVYLRDDDEPLAELSSVNVGHLFELLGRGTRGLELLIAIAHDLELLTDARIGAAMVAVQSDVACVDQLDELLDDTSISASVRDRLVVAFAMLGAAPMLPRVRQLMMSSEPAYASLRAVLRSHAVPRDLMQASVVQAREAVQALSDKAPPEWDLDFAELAASVRFEASSETERTLRAEWVADTVRQLTFGRLLQLLLPSERQALHRVARFVDSKATRDWLATWIPAYEEIAHAEAERLQARIDAKPDLLPALTPDVGTVYKRISNLALLLDEWTAQLDAGRWSDCLDLMVRNPDVFQSAELRHIYDTSGMMEPDWPKHTGRAALIHAFQEGGANQVRAIVNSARQRLDASRRALDRVTASDISPAQIAFETASLEVLRDETDAAGYFYAAEALLLLNNDPGARELMKMCAERTSPHQAWQGRKTLIGFGEQHGIDPDRIESLREILADRAAEPVEDDGKENDGMHVDEDSATGDETPEAPAS
jgi:hypothetical protein